ncbi:alpha/beta fold hydrolase [Asticcacaulis solisilvae]|uniref:alpha/beta fold hydrolase n=1 Tax=Asticcacaulis solisilvae TaxID=1217274 RepID=UPI003FD81556
MSPRVFFLPGVGGDPRFWQPVGDLLPEFGQVHFGWPGLGANPADPGINSYEDLVGLVVARFDGQPVDLVAQSMGGALAMTIALRYPDIVRRLVLTVTAGGMDIAKLGATDWRPEYRREFPAVADWVIDQRPDVSDRFADIRQPSLLLWGDDDPISPVAVGEYLQSQLPDAHLHVVKDGQHDLARTHAAEIAPMIAAHLG